MNPDDKKTVEMYCVKCKMKREAKDATPLVMKNGRPAVSGVCSTCGTKMFKIGGGAPKTDASVKIAA